MSQLALWDTTVSSKNLFPNVSSARLMEHFNFVILNQKH